METNRGFPNILNEQRKMDSLRAAYNLEDEVGFPGEGIDSNTAQSRPKRTHRVPARYCDPA